jgi:hypothetical protein
MGQGPGAASPGVRNSAVECMDLASGCCELRLIGKDRRGVRIRSP